MILDALLATCLFTAIVALLTVPFMPGPTKDANH